jgi:hypothetical protein
VVLQKAVFIAKRPFVLIFYCIMPKRFQIILKARMFSFNFADWPWRKEREVEVKVKIEVKGENNRVLE